MTKPRKDSVYGKLQIAKNREAYEIWRSRFDEPGPLPMIGFRSDSVVSDEDSQRRLLAKEVLEFLDGRISPRDWAILHMRHMHDATLSEIAYAFGVTRVRVAQIEKALLQKLSQYRTILGGSSVDAQEEVAVWHEEQQIREELQDEMREQPHEAAEQQSPTYPWEGIPGLSGVPFYGSPT